MKKILEKKIKKNETEISESAVLIHSKIYGR